MTKPDTSISYQATILEYHEALADILCWVDGYEAASHGQDPFARLNIRSLRNLKSDLHRKLYGKAPEWIA